MCTESNKIGGNYQKVDSASERESERLDVNLESAEPFNRFAYRQQMKAN